MKILIKATLEAVRDISHGTERSLNHTYTEIIKMIKHVVSHKQADIRLETAKCLSSLIWTNQQAHIESILSYCQKVYFLIKKDMKEFINFITKKVIGR